VVLARSVQRSFTVRGDADQAQRRHAERVDDLGVSRLLFSSEAARMTLSELLDPLGGATAPLETGHSRLSCVGSTGSVVDTVACVRCRPDYSRLVLGGGALATGGKP
jgi:hypothetical protein